MKLGIFVNTDKNLDAVQGITKAAARQGPYRHRCSIWMTERRSCTPRFSRNCAKTAGCFHQFLRPQRQAYGRHGGRTSKEIVCGSQYNNAVMLHEADRVIVLVRRNRVRFSGTTCESVFKLFNVPKHCSEGGDRIMRKNLYCYSGSCSCSVAVPISPCC